MPRSLRSTSPCACPRLILAHPHHVLILIFSYPCHLRGLGSRRTLADAGQFGVHASGDQLNEDDVVHYLGALPKFDGKLAEEDSERLMTYLVRACERHGCLAVKEPAYSPSISPHM